MSISLINVFMTLPPKDSGESVFFAVGEPQFWICPPGVYSVCVVAVGGGGAGNHGPGDSRDLDGQIYPPGVNSGGGRGGGGGGLGWRNNIPVTAGNYYAVVVGSGGSDWREYDEITPDGRSPFGNGGDSYFIDPTIVKGGGGKGALYNVGGAGGTFVGAGGGKGGSCTTNGGPVIAYAGGGGAGAGGYSGTGGADTKLTVKNTKASLHPDRKMYFCDYHVAGNGGAANSGAGGAGGTSDTGVGPGGGGVGIFGKGMTGGGGGIDDWRLAFPGGGGSGGEPGGTVIYPSGQSRRNNYSGNGGLYGGGGGGGYISYDSALGGSGGDGVVRIIWGAGRSFPLQAGVQ